MSIYLKEHNAVAYESVKSEFEAGNKAAVIHPTGTGKSYIALKLVEDNKGKRVLYLAPTNPILHQVKENIIATEGKMYSNVKRMTYSKLNNLTEEQIAALGCDIIVLDEFHHCGAPKWGQAVQSLIDSNPEAKVLGLSATPIRYFDGNIDMAHELFDEHIASEMSFTDAIDRDILPSFDYVSTLYGYQESLSQLREQIDASTVTKSKKEEAYRLWNELSVQLGENVRGLSDILDGHMTNRNGKYLVFCRNVEDMKQKIGQAEKLFVQVNPNMKIYSVSSRDEDIRQNEKTLKEFANDKDENTLKLMFSVNMLNEGFHLPDVDGVVMMRPTKSPTIYIQQLGRALNVGNTKGKKPVIIDLVDNFDTIQVIEDFAERMRKYGENPDGRRSKQSGNRNKVTVYDYTKDARTIIGEIEKLSIRKSLSVSEKIDLFEEFQNETDEAIIGGTIYKGYPIGQMLLVMRSELKDLIGTDEEKQIEQVEKYSKDDIKRLMNMGLLEKRVDSTLEEKVERLAAFCRNNPKVWLTKGVDGPTDDEEIKRLAKELEIAKKDYVYITVRRTKGKLSADAERKLKESGVYGIFGYPTYIEELAKKYNKDEKEIQHIIGRYGNLETFKEKYIQSLLLQQMIAEQDMRDSSRRYGEYSDIMEEISRYGNDIITTIDVTAQNLIYNNKNYLELVRELYGYTPTIVDGKKLEEELDRMIAANLSERNAKMLREYLGLDDGNWRKIDDLANEYGVTRGNITGILNRAIKNLRRISESNSGLNKAIHSEMILSDREKLIRSFFDECDVFYSSEIAINEQTRKKWSELYKHIAEKMKLSQTEEQAAKEELVEKLAIELDTLDLSVRTFNCLYRANVRTLGQLTMMTRQEVMNLRNMSARPLKEIEDKIHSLGLSFADEMEKNEFEETKMEQDKSVQTPLTDIYLSENASVCLERAGIVSVEQLASMSTEEVAKIENMDGGTLEEINRKVAAFREMKKQQEKLTIKIDTLDLSVRSFNCLNRANVQTLGQLTMMTRQEIMNLRNMGASSLKEIEDKVHALGLSFKDEVEKAEYEKIKKEQPENRLTLPVEELGISPGSCAALRCNKITVLSQLVTYTKRELISLRGLGEKSVAEIESKLELIGLSLVNKSEKNTIEELKKRQGGQEKILEADIGSLDLSVRAFNCLKRANIQTLWQLTMMTRQEIMKLRNMGARSLKEIEDKIHSLGLSLATEEQIVTNESTQANTNELKYYDAQNDEDQPKSSLTEQLQRSILELKSAYAKLEEKERQCERIKASLIYKLKKIQSIKQGIYEKMAQIEYIIQHYCRSDRYGLEWLEEKLERVKEELSKALEEENQVGIQIDEMDSELQEVTDKKKQVKSDITDSFQDL